MVASSGKKELEPQKLAAKVPAPRGRLPAGDRGRI